MRVAVVTESPDAALLQEIAEDGTGRGPFVRAENLADAVAERERPGDVRWVWAETAAIYPLLLRAGVRVERCHDVALTERLLLGRDGRGNEPATLAAAWLRLRGWPAGVADGTAGAGAGLAGAGTGVQAGAGLAGAGTGVQAGAGRGGADVPSGAAGGGAGIPSWPGRDDADVPSGATRGRADVRPGPGRSGADVRSGPGRGGSGQAALFEPPDPVFPDARSALEALVAVHAGQLRRIAADEHPGRFGLLAAAESAAGLAAAEMGCFGLPWRADRHAELLTEMLGPRPSPGLRPARLAGLAAQISAAFGGRPVNPDSPAQLLRAFAADGIRITSTRSSVLRQVEHPAAALLLEYKDLARLYAAHGWSWLGEWVTGGRFHPEYVVGGVVSGRWATRGGGALQIPRVLRRAVVADPGWVLVVADAAQLEPRVLAALAGDRAFAAAAGTGDLYTALAGAFGGDRAKAKVALLSAMYGGAGGEAGQLLAVLRRRFPVAAQYVEAAARAGEEGRVVRSRLGRTCPPPSAAWRGLTAVPDDPDAGEANAGRTLRARGRFTRNFVVQASAADWATVLLAGLRQRLAALPAEAVVGRPGPAAAPGGPAGQAASGGRDGEAAPGGPAGQAASGGTDREAAVAGVEAQQASGLECAVQRAPDLAAEGQQARLVFFQHDEVIVHCPRAQAEAVVAAVQEAATEAGRLVFGDTPVRFPVTTAVVDSYADAK